MLKIISANVNGIRSAYKKGFYEYIAASGADIVCVQELKAQEADLSADMKNPHGMHGHWHCAEKRGDWNIAHQNIDLKNWKGNQKNSGFLPEEREWIGRVIRDLGWTDMWRTLYPDNPGYTWWSNRGQAYAKDVGWRIDYQMVTPELAAKAVSAHVYKDEKFSDHAPLVVEYDYAV